MIIWGRRLEQCKAREANGKWGWGTSGNADGSTHSTPLQVGLVPFWRERWLFLKAGGLRDSSIFPVREGATLVLGFCLVAGQYKNRCIWWKSLRPGLGLKSLKPGLGHMVSLRTLPTPAQVCSWDTLGPKGNHFLDSTLTRTFIKQQQNINPGRKETVVARRYNCHLRGLL